MNRWVVGVSVGLLVFAVVAVFGLFLEYRDFASLRDSIRENAKGISEIRDRVAKVERSFFRTSESIRQSLGVVLEREVVYTIASFYAKEFSGRPTASGEIFNPEDATTAAHPDLPLGAVLFVENLRNGRSTVVRVNDRGPFVEGRGLDVSRAVAERLGMIEDGIVPVRITVFHLPLR